ncbi:growth-regulating factor 3-like isoform X2 [Cornus florida]|uniref:growth-regulating factor 3-like isoform X2 n=1 Tax=Cornus florida TaxID=4283 RepID=UPI00289981CF|nr:growth-regulating factor 3-like isoform X2 [Cornus florida]
MEHQTLRSILPANSGKGGVGGRNHWDKAWPVMSSKGEGLVREGSPSIKFGLGIGVCSGGPSHLIQSGFTPVQLHELNLQALIFKYIVAGLPVPFHLLLPIRKSVEAHFGSANGGIYNQFPSFIGFSYQGLDYRSVMDPEPGRCRRTDGKKWRCSKDVVPDQKYCERHMHRGRNRSRKLVEASEIASESDASTAINFSTTVSTLGSSSTYKTNAKHSTTVPLNLQLKTPSSDISRSAPTTVIATTSSISSFSRNNYTFDVNKGSTPPPTAITTCTVSNGSKSNVGVKKEPITTTTTTINATFGSNNNGNSNDCISIKGGFCDHINDNNIHRSSNFGSNGGIYGSKSIGFGFSPRSVLQVAGCSNPCFNHRKAEEPEPQRCRRTDGKKWRCNRDVVPDHKYCGRHVNRGTKKLVVDHHQVSVAAAPITGSAQPPCPLGIPKKADNHMNLNTNLSISIPESPQPTIKIEKSTTSSSSDATTISDEFISVSH